MFCVLRINKYVYVGKHIGHFIYDIVRNLTEALWKGERVLRHYQRAHKLLKSCWIFIDLCAKASNNDVGSIFNCCQFTIFQSEITELNQHLTVVKWGSVGDLQMQTSKRIYELNEAIISTENNGIREPMISHIWFYVPSTALLREK